MNDECPMCGAPLLSRIKDVRGKHIKLGRQAHLAHVSKRIDSLRKNGKSNAALEQHEERLSVNWPCGAVKLVSYNVDRR